VIFLDVEHHANLLPWRQLPHRCITASHTLAGTLERLADALRERPAALVAVTGSSNVTGEILPVARIAAIAHAHGARVVVDAAQLAPHRRIDVEALGIDYLAFSGHKVYAPFGTGVLVGRRDWLDAAPAYLAGGGAVREVGEVDTDWAPAPQRHEGGTPNVLGAAALAAACRAIAALPEGALEAHEAQLRARLLRGLAGLRGVRVLEIWPDSSERIGVVAFTITGHDSGRVAAYLSAEHGIGVRDGRFCAHPLLTRLGHGDGAVRASLGVGSSSQDVDRLVAALAELLQHGENWSYALDAGRWTPCPDPRPTADWLTGVAALTGVAGQASDGSSPCIPQP
jgi:selenocysteine lyase/cysteine desulfurase